MRLDFIVILFLIALASSNAVLLEDATVQQGQSAKTNSTTERNERFLSLFTVVRFGNNRCTGSSNYAGTCLTSVECTAEGGIASGTCASGFGVCCVFNFTACGSMTSRNCSYFSTPVLPTTGSLTCTYMINKCSTDICQIRLDFISFVTAQPENTLADAATNCLVDQFSVLNAANSVPPMCGVNTGQHMYFDVTTTSFIKLNFVFTSLATAVLPARNWTIKATQIPCCSMNLAPYGCLQYYTEVSGMIMSFNYDSVMPINSVHLANQDYSICFRMEVNYCRICYTACSVTNGFAISGTTASVSDTVLANCYADYLLIPGGQNQGTNTAAMAADRICGGALNAMTAGGPATVCSRTKPFLIHFTTDTNEAAMEIGVNDKGFCLKYVQHPCT